MAHTAVLVLVLALCRASVATVDLTSVLEQAIKQHYFRQTSNQAAPSGRIIGGQNIYDRCQPPYSSLVAIRLLEDNREPKVIPCAAVMLSNEVLLTSALCVAPYTQFEQPVLVAVVGEKNPDVPDQGEQRIPITFKIFPDYNQITGDNNIAVIKLLYPATLGPCVQPIPRFVRKATQCVSGLKDCVIAGWGQSQSDGNVFMNSNFPTSANIQLADETLSKYLNRTSMYNINPYPEGSIFGLPSTGTKVQTCYMDWGGPAYCYLNGEYALHGVIGQQNCRPTNNTKPMIITSVEKYQGWIDVCVNDFDSAGCTSKY